MRNLDVTNQADKDFYLEKAETWEKLEIIKSLMQIWKQGSEEVANHGSCLWGDERRVTVEIINKLQVKLCKELDV